MLRLGCEGKIVYLTLDRPAARNAITGEGWDQIAERIADVARTDARLLVVTGAGGTFSAGVDLSEFDAFEGQVAEAARLRQRIRTALDRLRALEIPTVALIEGPCYGSGVALAIACDLRIAAPEARFAITPAKLGIAYPQEDVHRLVRLVGAGQAARLLFTAGMIDAMEARRIGLVEMVEAPGAAKSILKGILGNSAASLAVLKRSIRLTAQGVRSDPEQDRLFDELLAGTEVRERLEALRAET
jgi:enoyl-CoA hydratase/carnithine racemase